MNWTGSVARTERVGNILNIIVHYTDGTNEFDETYSTSSWQPDSWLADNINDRLRQLTALDDFESKIIKSDTVTSDSISLATEDK